MISGDYIWDGYRAFYVSVSGLKPACVCMEREMFLEGGVIPTKQIHSQLRIRLTYCKQVLINTQTRIFNTPILTLRTPQLFAAP